MTNEEVRIACAEALGWTKCRLVVKGSGAPERGPSPYGIPPGKSYEAPVPNYPGDLNACHEMEKVLTDDQQKEFIRCLWKLADRRKYRDDIQWSYWPMLHATPPERCAAFLKAIGRWKEMS